MYAAYIPMFTEGGVFIPTADAPPPPPEEVRNAFFSTVETRLQRLEPRLDALKERVFAYNGDNREGLTREVSALMAERQQWAAAAGGMRDTVPASYNAMHDQWDAALAGLEARALRVETAVTP